MGAKKINGFPIINAQAMVNSVTSSAQNVQNFDNIGLQITWTGTPTGTIAVLGSNDDTTYYALTFQPALAQPAGAVGGYLVSINQFPFPYMKVRFTSTALTAQTVATVADSSGSLNNKYFYLNSANGTTGYYVWFNVNSAGTDPAIAGKTGIAVAIATGATAGTVGSTMATAIAAVGSSLVFSASGTTTVTITSLVTGPMVLATDAGSTGFTFAGTTGTGTLDVQLFSKDLN